jgi:hypothetical protein
MISSTRDETLEIHFANRLRDQTGLPIADWASQRLAGLCKGQRRRVAARFEGLIH